MTTELRLRTSGRPLVLMTGFGPFPTVAANATSLLVPRIAEAAGRSFSGIDFACHILPTEWGAGLSAVENLYLRLQPSIALHFGVSGKAQGFEIETRAKNWCSQSADAAGLMPPARQVSVRGPDYLPATLPATHIAERLRRRGLPAVVSRDAGAYLCNALLYRTLQVARTTAEPPRSGFIHLPSSLVNERNPWRGPHVSCRMGWDDVIEGGLEIVAVCLGRPSPALSVARRWAQNERSIARLQARRG